MNFVLILGGIFFVLIGYYIMNRLDVFLVGSTNRDHKKTEKKVLIYGNNLISDKITARLTNEAISYEKVQDVAYIKKEAQYYCVVALSEEDLDNLMMCVMSEKVHNKLFSIALCNDYRNKLVFEKYKIKILHPSNQLEEQLIYSIKGEINKCLN